MKSDVKYSKHDTVCKYCKYRDVVYCYPNCRFRTEQKIKRVFKDNDNIKWQGD